MKRILLALVAATAVFAAAWGAAAALPVENQPYIQAANVDDLVVQEGELTVLWKTMTSHEGFMVIGVTLEGFNSAAEGGKVLVALWHDSPANQIGFLRGTVVGTWPGVAVCEEWWVGGAWTSGGVYAAEVDGISVLLKNGWHSYDGPGL